MTDGTTVYRRIASLAKKTAVMVERFMRIDARGFNQGQELKSSTNRPETLAHDGACLQPRGPCYFGADHTFCMTTSSVVFASQSTDLPAWGC